MSTDARVCTSPDTRHWLLSSPTSQQFGVVSEAVFSFRSPCGAKSPGRLERRRSVPRVTAHAAALVPSTGLKPVAHGRFRSPPQLAMQRGRHVQSGQGCPEVGEGVVTSLGKSLRVEHGRRGVPAVPPGLAWGVVPDVGERESRRKSARCQY